MQWRLNHYRLVFLSFSDSTRGSLLHFSFARPSSRCKRCHAIMHREFTFLEYWKKQFMYSLESPMHHCFLIGALTGVGAMPINVPYEHFKVKAQTSFTHRLRYLEFLQRTVGEHGFFALYKGISVVHFIISLQGFSSAFGARYQAQASTSARTCSLRSSSE